MPNPAAGSVLETSPRPGRRRPRCGPAAAALLACAVAILPAGALDAQEPAPAPRPVESVAVDLTVEGVNHDVRPRARVTLDRPAYVAVFEVEPGVGAVMLWPDDLAPQRRMEAGTHAFRLNGPRMGLRRSLMLWHLSSAFLFRSSLQTRAHLVAVASEEPLRTDGLHSDRVFAYRHGTAPTREVTGALLTRVVPSPIRTPWSYATVSFSRYWEGLLGAVADPLVWAPFLPVHVPLSPGLDLALRDRCGPASFFSVYASLVPAVLRRDVCVSRTPIPRLTAPSTLPYSVPSGEERDDAATPVPPDAPDEPAGPGGADLPADAAEILRRVADARERASGSPGESDRRLEGLAEILSARGLPVRPSDMRRVRREARVRAARATRLRRMERFRRMMVEHGGAGAPGTAAGGSFHPVPGPGGPGRAVPGRDGRRDGGVGSVRERVRSAVERVRDRSGGSGGGSGAASSGGRSTKGG